LMPDYHPGEGSMIGSVIPTRDVLLPSVIGGDLGCGMTAAVLPLDAQRLLPGLRRLDGLLRARIPVGTAHNPQVTDRVRSNPIWQREFRAPVLANRLQRKMMRQFASLGGGNHFLEIQQDQEGRAWIMLHSGSRYLGVAVRDYYIEHGQHLDGIDRKLYSRLPHLPAATPAAEDYFADLGLVLDFARESRKEMLNRAVECVAEIFPEYGERTWQDASAQAYDIVHNFIAREQHFGRPLFVHRKGAIRLDAGQVGLIPGSMGTASYIVEGRGNAFGYCSGSHGAGRAMSRADAFRTISDHQFLRSMEGVVHEDDVRMKDEAPAAYKDIQHVMRSQKDLVKIVHHLRPLLSVKGR
jgi:tRNA-splicing ligase RtcB (3'-phosphate/5'-hydroxy nucleic acid ligase)